MKLTNDYYISNKHVGFIYDLSEVDNKDWKFVFSQYVQSEKKWWLGEPSKYQDAAKLRNEMSKYFIEVKDLKKLLLENTKKNQPVTHRNEILVGLSKNSLIGLFFQVNEEFCGERMVVYHKNLILLLCTYFKIKSIINKDLPIFKFTLPLKKFKTENLIQILPYESIIECLLNEKKQGETVEFVCIHKIIFGEHYDIKEILKLNNENYKKLIDEKISHNFILNKNVNELNLFYKSTLNSSLISF